jgi:hypothetical protein
MDVVVHEAVGPEGKTRLVGPFREQAEAEGLVVVREKDRLAAVPTLGDVVRDAGDDDARGSGHGNLTRRSKKGDTYRFERSGTCPHFTLKDACC